jgi:hypothetical protein
MTQPALPPALLPDLPGSSGLKSASADAGLALAETRTGIPFQWPEAIVVSLDISPGRTKPDAIGNVAPRALVAGAADSGPAFSSPSSPQPSPQLDISSRRTKPNVVGNVTPQVLAGGAADSSPALSFPSSPQLNQAEASQAGIVNQDAIAVGRASPAKAPQVYSDPISVNANPLPEEGRLQAPDRNSIPSNSITMLAAAPSEAANQLNSIDVETTPAIIHSDSPSAGGGTAVSSPDAFPQNVARGQDSAGSLAGSGASFHVNAPQENTKQENITAPMVRPDGNPPAGHQAVMAAPPSAPSNTRHDGKPNATGAENPLSALNKLGPNAPSTISAESRNALASSSSATLDAPSTAANISAILTSAAFAMPLANGSDTAGVPSIASKDNRPSSSELRSASPTTTPQSILFNKDSSNNVSQAAGPAPDAAVQTVHRSSIPGAVQPVVAQSGPPQAPIVAAPVDAGRQPAAGHAAMSQSLPNPASRNLPTSTESAPLMSSVGEPHAALSLGPVQMAQIVSKATQAEMRVGLNTSAFGNVEVRTVVHASEVGLVIGSERGDLRTLLGSEIPGIANTLQQQNLRLNEVTFHQGFTFSGNLSSGSDSQPRSFTPPPVPAHSPAGETRADNSTEPVVAETTSHRRTGLNILA